VHLLCDALPRPDGRALVSAGTVVIAIGNAFRRDDGVALRVLDELRRVAPSVRAVALDGEPCRLLDTWADADVAIVVEACRSGAPPGAVHHIELVGDALDASPSAVSSHGVGLADAVLLAHALGRSPRRLRLVTVDVADVGVGLGLSPPVAAAVPEVVARVLQAVSEHGGTVSQQMRGS
jgi:hydrogenase maturation protease